MNLAVLVKYMWGFVDNKTIVNHWHNMLTTLPPLKNQMLGVKI